MKNSNFRKSSYRQKNFLKKNYMELEFHVTFASNSIFIKSSFSWKLDFLKIEFQNMDILLDSFRT